MLLTCPFTRGLTGNHRQWRTEGGTLGTIIDWISSGKPISQPEPEALARELLTQGGLQLFRDSSAGLSTHNRRRIGYVCRNAELIRLAHLLFDDAAETGTHLGHVVPKLQINTRASGGPSLRDGSRAETG